MTSDRIYACRLFADTAWDAQVAVGRCVDVLPGPALLTDVQTTGECHDLLAIGAGDAQHPTWVLIGEPSSLLAIHGARYPVAAGEALFVAQGSTTPRSLGRGVECGVTWAAQQ